MHANQLRTLPTIKRRELVDSLSEAEARALLYDWAFWARPEQLPPPGDWRLWLIIAGRGNGKTRCGAETTRMFVEAGKYGRVALIGPTAGDARDIMVEGPSGLLAVSPPWFRPDYEPSKHRLTWPNGAVGAVFSADEPDRLRGPQHDFLWADEPRSWRTPSAWDNALLGLRLGRDPRAVATTTPSRTALIRRLLATPGAAITRGTTYDNRDNLAAAFFEHIVSQYEGTALGRQELYGDLIERVEGALWHMQMIEAGRTQHPLPDPPPPSGGGKRAEPGVAGKRVGGGESMQRIVVAIDPAVSAEATSSETGIIVAGLDERGEGVVLADLSLRASPARWAARAIAAYDEWGADRIIVEANQGGDMVEHTLRAIDDRVSVRAVHATRGKLTRAEPVAALYEKGRVHHAGLFPELEDQMCSWVPGDPSPDRLDAMVWALSDLMLSPRRAVEVVESPFYG